MNSEQENVVLEEKLQRRLCSFLDENFPEDLSNVRQCLERMEIERNALEKQVAFLKSITFFALLLIICTLIVTLYSYIYMFKYSAKTHEKARLAFGYLKSTAFGYLKSTLS